MKQIILTILCLWGIAYGQTTGYFRYDTIRMQKGGGNSELYIENATRGVTNGVLTNVGNGRTAFVTPSTGAVATEVRVVYVDSLFGNNTTAKVGDASKPFSTINRALDSLGTQGGTIYIGIGTFASPSSAKLKSNITIIGTQMPAYNWTVTQSGNNYETATAPTKLINGTILQGKMLFSDMANIHLENLGIDCGPDYVAGGGTESDCFAFGVTGTIPYTAASTVTLRNVILLGKTPSSAFHAAVIEGAVNVLIDNVTTCFSTHGIAVKCTGGVNISNTHSYSHTLDAIIIKADTRASGDVIVNNFFISSLNPLSVDGGGLVLHNLSSVLHNVTVSNGNIVGTSFGLRTDGSAAVNNNITGVNVFLSSGAGFEIQTLYNSTIRNCRALNCSADGFYIRTDASFSNAIKLSGCESYYNGDDGFDLGGTTYPVIFSELYTNGNTGYGIRAGSNVYGELYENVANTAGATTGVIIPRSSVPTLQQVLTAGSTLTGDNTIVNGASTLEISNNSLGNDFGFLVSSNSTAAAGGGQILGSFLLSGANANSAQTTIALAAGNNHTGTTSTNIGGQFSATDGTNNYAIIVPASSGLVGIGTSAPTELLEVVGGSIKGRWKARVGSTTSSGTPAINTDVTDVYKLTAQAANITSMSSNLSGTPVDGDILEVQITGTGSFSLAWGTSFVSSTVTLPTAITTATLTVILQYYTTSSYGNNKWVCTNFY